MAVIVEVVKLNVVDGCLLGRVVLMTVENFVETKMEVHSLCQICTNRLLLCDLVCHIVGIEFYLYPFQLMVLCHVVDYETE